MNHFLMPPPIVMTEHDLIFKHMASGVTGSDVQFSMYVFFYPNAPSYHNLQLSAVYRRHENEKKRNYEARVREVEHGSFTPLVFSTSGGMGMLVTAVYKRLASQIAIKRD